MRTARREVSHHAEWLSLVDVSGPFFALTVLDQVMPQGVDPHEPRLTARLRQAYREWREAPAELLRPWTELVLKEVFGFQDSVLVTGQAVPPRARVRLDQYGETLSPDWAVVEGGTARLLVSVTAPGQSLERPVPGMGWVASPAWRMVELLHGSGVRLGMVTNGEHYLLVHAPSGEPSGFASWYAEMWLEEPVTLRALRSLFGAGRFFGDPAETPEKLLERSSEYQHEVTDQLGSQVRRAVELLVSAFDRCDRSARGELLAGLSDRELFQAALTVMMRLVFLLAAEERDLLPRTNRIYADNYAVCTLRDRLQEAADLHGEEVLERRHDAWGRMLAAFRAVHAGVQHEDLHLPAYGGSLFDPDRYPFLEGRARGSHYRNDPAKPLPIDNRIVLYMLRALQLLQEKTGARRVSFRALDIEQIGHVYESLLDHTARRSSSAVLGLDGVKGREPEVPLSDLEAARAAGRLTPFLREATGLSERRVSSISYDVRVEDPRLLMVCDQDHTLYRAVAPYADLLRDDPLGHPVVIPPGGIYVTQGSDRRSTGTHYTPRNLTEEMVQHTLDPLVYLGVDQGHDPTPESLREPSEILKLRVCDLTMGSGAFLVQSCRYLSARLVESWARYGGPEDLPSEPEARLAVARRLVAERCLYGVDRDPLAVEMAKLSLWLITLDVARPFSFLDHALRCGDSLLGVTSRDQLESFALQPTGQRRLESERIVAALDRAEKLREELESFTSLDPRDAERKSSLLNLAVVATGDLRLLGDALVGASLSAPNPREHDVLCSELLTLWEHGELDRLRSRARVLLNQGKPAEAPEREPFHWLLEFPEVFASEENPGFDAVVGNPPFIGGQKITGVLGTDYREFLVAYLGAGKRGSADLVAYFFLQAGRLVRASGSFGLLATNTLAQGDTREVGLDQLAATSSVPVRAVPSRKWPGRANLEISQVWLHRGPWDGGFRLNDEPVRGLTPALTVPGRVTGNPYRLAANAKKSFIGSLIVGMGFILSAEEAHELIEKNSMNRTVLCPFLTGEDLNTRPDQSASRWVINFQDWPVEEASRYEDCFEIIERLVKPERERNRRATRRTRWWQFAERAAELYRSLTTVKFAMPISSVSKHLCFGRIRSDLVFDHNLAVITLEDFGSFALLSSNLHLGWAQTWSSTLESRAGYRPSDAFETFPFPKALGSLETIGDNYYEHRRQIMLARREGMTKTYNRFHSSEETADDITSLREQQCVMDQAVASVYGWSDLDLGHDFHQTPQGVRFTLSEPARREVLDRLLELNHERYAEEVRQGLHERTRPRGSRKAQKPSEELFS